MTPLVITSPAPRRRHSPEFKARLVAESLQLGASIAGIALAHQINANQLHKWIREHHQRQQGPGHRPANAGDGSQSATLVPLSVAPGTVPAPSDIQIEIRHQQTTIHIAWPTSHSAACADWLREVLR